MFFCWLKSEKAVAVLRCGKYVAITKYDIRHDMKMLFANFKKKITEELTAQEWVSVLSGTMTFEQFVEEICKVIL